MSPVTLFISTLPCLQAYSKARSVSSVNILAWLSSGTALLACMTAASQPRMSFRTRWTALTLSWSWSHQFRSCPKSHTAWQHVSSHSTLVSAQQVRSVRAESRQNDCLTASCPNPTVSISVAISKAERMHGSLAYTSPPVHTDMQACQRLTSGQTNSSIKHALASLQPQLVNRPTRCDAASMAGKVLQCFRIIRVARCCCSCFDVFQLGDGLFAHSL